MVGCCHGDGRKYVVEFCRFGEAGKLSQPWEQTVIQEDVGDCRHGRTGLQRGLGVDVAQHSFPPAMWCVIWHGEHGHHTIVAENVRVPVALFETAGVDGSYATLDGVDGDLVWRNPHNRSQSFVSRVYGGCVLLEAPFVEDP